MRLETIAVRNFRLLRRLSIDLARDKTTTIFVGPNNSGKTSVMDALRVIGTAGVKAPEVSFHDLSQLRHKDFRRIESLIAAAPDGTAKAAIVRRFAPRIRLDLTFSYTDDPADLIAATDLLMDLDAGANRIRVRIDYSIKNAKQLVDEFEVRPVQNQSLCEFLKGCFARHYERSYAKVSDDGTEVVPLDDGAPLKRLLKIDLVPAQRHVDDEETSRSAKLSKLLHDHYTRFYKVWIGAEARLYDIQAKHIQLLWNLKLCGVPIGADRTSKNGFLEQLQTPVMDKRGIPLRRRSTPVMTDARTPSCPPSVSPQPSSSGYRNES